MRQCGILMHISSLPSDVGIGKLGASARYFADFLQASGVTLWQVLPLTPTSFGDSPYQSFSVFAGNPYFIDYDQLVAQGLLKREEFASIDWGEDPSRVDYQKQYENCLPILRKAAGRFQETPEYRLFLDERADWLDDYALFMAIKDANGGKSWDLWDDDLKKREKEAINRAKKTYAEDIRFYKITQFLFAQQWEALRQYCHERGISLIGDMPIYAAFDSADVWANPSLFRLDDDLKPSVVAGCPPDIFSVTGQLWGNPIYDWQQHQAQEYAWWIRRLGAAAAIYDVVRIDHFRGFESYYAIPYGEPTAEVGAWEKGPGMALFRAAKKKLGDFSVIAEDLGFVTDEVRALLCETGYPGMKVLQFAFDGDATNEYLPCNYTSPNCLVYTGTHDNMTLREWVRSLSEKECNFAKQYLGVKHKSHIIEGVIRAAWNSIAMWSIVQMQDFLDLGAEGRMNTPSTLGNNWQYRADIRDLNGELAEKIYKLGVLYNRTKDIGEDGEKKRLRQLKKSKRMVKRGK